MNPRKLSFFSVLIFCYLFSCTEKNKRTEYRLDEIDLVPEGIAYSLTALFTFDLTSGKLLKRYALENSSTHFLNDLIQDNQGHLYAVQKWGA